jgi:PTH1 family peptidyl-tRNA hydrolase
VRVIFGLGNPGSEYDGTRHNIGFSVLDTIADERRLKFFAGKGEYEITKPDGENGFVLVKPLTYMNNSGIAVREVLGNFGVEPGESLTIVDDFELPLGTLRMRSRGSAGTHNGLTSIIWALESEDFPRLRCGIGSAHKPADRRHTADFVLSPFAREERPIVAEMVRRAAQVAISFGTISLQEAFEVLTHSPK